MTPSIDIRAPVRGLPAFCPRCVTTPQPSIDRLLAAAKKAGGGR